MASRTPKKSTKDILCEEVLIPETYLVGIFWNEPELFELYNSEQLNRQTFLNPTWGFFYGLGRYMYQEKGVTVFDDITVFKYVTELKQEGKYEQYGGYETVDEIMQEVKGKDDNIDGYYNEVKKYCLLRDLVDLFGSKVLEDGKKYDYHKMTREQLQNFWLDKVNKLAMDGDSRFVEANLLESLEDSLDIWDKSPSIGLEFYQSPKMTAISVGWEFGHIYIHGGFGGRGKTSLTFNKVVMSCIINQEKLLVIANEQDVEDFRKMLLITALGVGTHKFFNRQRINEGGFSDEERERLDEAIEWVRSVAGDDNKLIKFVFMESYTMDNVRKVVTHYAMRGYKSVLIDTGKPSDELGGMARWERFTEDFKELYKIIKPNTGLNLRCWVNVQLADGAVTQRFLDYQALGDSRKIKNEAAVVFMSRPFWSTEYKGGKDELKIYNYIPREQAEEEDPFNASKEYKFIEGKEYALREFSLSNVDEKGHYQQYYLLFTPKNRRGKDNNTGLDCLVLKPNFNNNTWKEIGWANIPKDYGH